MSRNETMYMQWRRWMEQNRLALLPDDANGDDTLTLTPKLARDDSEPQETVHAREMVPDPEDVDDFEALNPGDADD